MHTQKQLDKLNLHVQRIDRLALDMALSAAELSHYGQGLTIVADETRTFSKKLHACLEKETIDTVAMCDTILQIKLLAINGCLEMLRVQEEKWTAKNKISVILDEMNHIAAEMETALGMPEEPSMILPRVSEKSAVVADTVIRNSNLRFVLFTIGEKQFCEPTDCVNEVFLYPTNQLDTTMLKIRGQELTLLNCHNRFSVPMPKKDFLPVLWITDRSHTIPKQYAVVIDGVPDIFFSGIGRPAVPSGIEETDVRECWNCEEDRQMIFLQYEALVP